jgi:hypothetical protein
MAKMLVNEDTATMSPLTEQREDGWIAHRRSSIFGSLGILFCVQF